MDINLKKSMLRAARTMLQAQIKERQTQELAHAAQSVARWDGLIQESQKILQARQQSRPASPKPKPPTGRLITFKTTGEKHEKQF